MKNIYDLCGKIRWYERMKWKVNLIHTNEDVGRQNQEQVKLKNSERVTLRMTKTLSKTNSTENWNESEKCNQVSPLQLARQEQPQTQRRRRMYLINAKFDVVSCYFAVNASSWPEQILRSHVTCRISWVFMFVRYMTHKYTRSCEHGRRISFKRCTRRRADVLLTHTIIFRKWFEEILCINQV